MVHSGDYNYQDYYEPDVAIGILELYSTWPYDNLCNRPDDIKSERVSDNITIVNNSFYNISVIISSLLLS